MRKRLFYLAYVFIGVLVASVVMMQLLIGNIFSMINIKQKLQNNKTTFEEVKSNKPVIVDNFSDKIARVRTYAQLNEPVYNKFGAKEDIIGVGSGSSISNPLNGTETKNTNTSTSESKDNTNKTGGSNNQPVNAEEPIATKTPELPIQTNPSITDNKNSLSGLSMDSSNNFKGVTLLIPVDKYNYTIGKRFEDIIINKDGYKEFYMGIDIVNKDNMGSEAFACLAGIVTNIQRNENQDAVEVEIENKNHNLKFKYGSLKYTPLAIGDVITAGDVIGITAVTGEYANTHLHLEITDTLSQSKLDPEKFNYN